MAGLLKKKEDRKEAEIPTSSMADIAFLLLIFFLVTTTIDVDTGIGMTLPPPLEEDQKPPPVKERNIFNILINAEGQVLIEDQPASISQIRERVKEQVLNYGEDPNLSENPEKSVISIKTDSQTPYNVYIDALDEVWMAYREIWDGIARTGKLPTGETLMNETFPSYQAFRATRPDGEDKNPIREAIGANISIAEPDRESEGEGS